VIVFVELEALLVAVARFLADGIVVDRDACPDGAAADLACVSSVAMEATPTMAAAADVVLVGAAASDNCE
jgi:hypothetical protein